MARNGRTKSRRGRRGGRGRLDGVMDEHGPVSRDEPRTDMFIRRLSVKVAVALLSRSSFVPYVSSEAFWFTVPVASASSSPGHRKGQLKREIIQSRD